MRNHVIANDELVGVWREAVVAYFENYLASA